MDERQTKIIEGAGLEDSRVNQEFIDLLKKWSQPVMLLVLLLAGGYAGLNYLSVWRVKQLDAAFTSFNDASFDGRPEALIEVAQKHEGRAAVGDLARMNAADLYLRAAQLRQQPGTQGLTAEDTLDDAQAAEMLARAGELYREVYDDTRSAAGQEVISVGARWGMVAVALSQGHFDEASAGLTEIISVAEGQGFTRLAADARALLDTLPALQTQRQPVASPPPAPEPAASEGETSDDTPPTEAPAPAGEEPDDSDG